VLLARADCDCYATIGAGLACADRFSVIWQRLFVEGGVLSLADAPRAGRRHGITAAFEVKIARVTLPTKPPAPLSHLTSRRLTATARHRHDGL
jgi:hypothetical protein